MGINSINISYPINDDTQKGGFVNTTKTTNDTIVSNLFLLFLTIQGERYYDPEYGTNLIKSIFDPNDSTTEGEIELEIKNTVPKYISNIRINSVSFLRDKDNEGYDIDDNQLIVNVTFTYEEGTINETNSINITF